MTLSDALRTVLDGGFLSRAQAREVFAAALCEEGDPVTLAGFLVALGTRGETAEEICGAAEALRAAAQVFEHDVSEAIDTCGTGGDGLGVFNLSTAAAVVACAAGAKVIKHGNRSISSRCGSADLLESAGIPLELKPDQARRIFEQEGIVFLFAPAWHPAMRFAAPVRRSLGVRTIFNLLGPLCSPARVQRQLLGVADEDRLDDFALALEGLGHASAYVVHGAGGADELTLQRGNRVRAVGAAPQQAFEAAALGLKEAPIEALAGGDIAQNLALLGRVFSGERGPLFDAVVLNASAALIVADVCGHAQEGIARASEALLSGAAQDKLDSWSSTARRVARESA